MPSPLLHTGDFLTHGLALTLLVFVGSFYYDELDVKLPSNAHGASTLYYKVEMEKQEALLAARETSNAIAKATVKGSTRLPAQQLISLSAGNAETLEQAMMAHKIEMNEVLEARQAEDALLRAQQEEKFDQLLKVVHALQQAQHTGPHNSYLLCVGEIELHMQPWCGDDPLTMCVLGRRTTDCSNHHGDGRAPEAA